MGSQNNMKLKIVNMYKSASYPNKCLNLVNQVFSLFTDILQVKDPHMYVFQVYQILSLSFGRSVMFTRHRI